MIKQKKIINKVLVVLMIMTILMPAVSIVPLTEYNAKAADYGISNPRISEDGTVTWDKIQFGSYWQSVKFEKQPIKWRILSVNEDGTDAFVMADRALDCKPYNETYEEVTWETCTLRSWLNNEFYNEAFSSGEQTAINEVTVSNENNTEYNSEGGNPTTDKVYLLSIDEASNNEYGFDSSFDSNSRTRYVKATDYARINGVYCSHSSDYVGNCEWWLRSSGSPSYGSLCVDIDGMGDFDLPRGDFTYIAIRPTLHINLSSVYVEDAGEVDSYGKVMTSDNGYNNPRTSDGVTTWDCVYFGKYKQDNVSDKEPIEWKVLSVNGDDAFIMADKALDCIAYNNTYDDMTWETCTLRGWLNSEFYNEAFNAKEQAAIREVPVTNEDNLSYNNEGGNSMTDKVYLLSIDEASKMEYGFDTQFGDESETRCIKSTDYARMNGAYCSNRSGYVGNCHWWLCAADSIQGAYVVYNGDGYYGGIYVKVDDIAVCPTLHINLSSDTWKIAGTVSAKLSNYNPAATPTGNPNDTPDSTPTAVPISTATSTSILAATQPVSKATQSPTPLASASATLKPKNTVTNMQIKLTSIKTKAKCKKITGKVSVKGVTIKIKVGNSKYKKATVKGKNFTLLLSKKLKKNTIITIIATKKNYKKFKKTYKVK